jgi:hypothetical protein
MRMDIEASPEFDMELALLALLAESPELAASELSCGLFEFLLFSGLLFSI